MRTVLVISAVTALTAAAAFGEWVYEGQWGSIGSGNGQFLYPYGIAVAPNGNVYVADSWNCRVQYFTRDGSFLGKWGSYGTGDGQFRWNPRLTVSASGDRVYVTDRAEPVPGNRVQYFTPTGSYLGEWGGTGKGEGHFLNIFGVAAAPKGNVYVTDWDNARVQYFTRDGHFLGKWGTEGFGDGQFKHPEGIAVAPNGNIYVLDNHVNVNRIQYFTPAGSFLGKWGRTGSGNGEFRYTIAITIAPNGDVYVADYWNFRIQYFTSTGSFLGKWGSEGMGPEQFLGPTDIALSRTGARLYVLDCDRAVHRVKYFNRNEPAITPTSLGKVKALFR
jgi:tripartite motif-containing protein 71